MKHLTHALLCLILLVAWASAQETTPPLEELIAQSRRIPRLRRQAQRRRSPRLLSC